jgi:aryl-alcohol dehydrogenase-like predicted oxidoreductase
MEYTQLGRTNLTVSRLGFGGAPAGLNNYLNRYNAADQSQREQVIEAIESALAQGITYFDTAADYGDGASERIFGEGLAGAGDHVVLASKVSNRMPVRASVERSLTNLRRETLDLIQIHGTDYHREKPNIP